MRRITISFLLCLLAASLLSAQQSQAVSPQQILDKMTTAYASCKSYIDEGRVETVFFPDNRPSWTSIKPFSTAFVRPSQFRFEFENTDTNRGSHYIVWRDESHVKSWWTIRPEVKLYETLSSALGAAAGVSSLSSLNVPTMLMPEFNGNRFTALSQLKLSQEEKVGDKTAYRIEGRDRRDSLVTIWVDKETFLLLKIYETKKLTALRTEQTTTYQPRVNTDIPLEKLAFNH